MLSSINDSLPGNTVLKLLILYQNPNTLLGVFLKKAITLQDGVHQFHVNIRRQNIFRRFSFTEIHILSAQYS